MGTVLEGAVRPTHFRGVLTVVAKLFNLIRPNFAVFGQKDFQQAALIKQMTRDLNFDVEIAVAPIMREPDGLAMSSRNIYLSPDERTRAAGLSRGLFAAQARAAAGERRVTALRDAVHAELPTGGDVKVDYVTVLDAPTFTPLELLEPGVPAVVLLAVRIGATRLIDNMIVTVPA